MAPDIYDDLKLINALKGGGTDAAFGRSNPVMRDFFASQQGMTNMRANQERFNVLAESRRERQQLKSAMTGMDMEKPDYGKLMGVAPHFTAELMKSMTDTNKEQRIKALQVANMGNEFLLKALPNLMHAPQSRPFIANQMKEWGFHDDYINAVVPDRSQYTSDGAFVNAIMLSLDATNTIKGNVQLAEEELKQKGERTKAQEKLGLEEAKHIFRMTEKDVSVLIARINKAGKPVEIEDKEGNPYLASVNEKGEVTTKKLGDGFKFRKKGGSGKGAETGAGKGSLRAAFGQEGTTPEFKPGTYRVNGKLVYIDTKAKFEALTK